MRAPTQLLLSDYAGHAFTYELALGLNEAGISTAYSYCSTTVAPRGSLDSDRIELRPVRSGKTFNKYNLPQRLFAEIRYGFGTSRLVWSLRPRTHLVANMPLVSLLVIWLATLPLRTRLVIWFQDVQSGLANSILGGGTIPRLLSYLESFMLRRAHRVVAISPELANEANRRGVRDRRLGVFENWAPVEEIPVRPRSNPWSERHGLTDKTVFLYSGTLARKHNPSMLIDLARAVADVNGVVIVVSEGEGAFHIAAAVQQDPSLTNLVVLPYQPFNELPDVLASADVLVVLLEPLAGPFSVPSKTLSYLCSQRPVLAAMPPENTAARILTDRAQAGVVVESGDSAGFCAAAVELAEDPDRRHDLGRAGRRYAEQHFAASVVIQAMVGELQHVM